MKNTRKKLSAFLICFCLSVLCASLAVSALPLHGEEAVYENVIRLHVLANSDSEEDQALKLQVRDAVLLYLENENLSLTDADTAEAALSARLSAIQRIAEQVTADAGYPYTAVVTLTEEVYPERDYDTFTFPAGTYRSLRICIGNAAGHNWWCVIFPPLCLSLAKDTKTEKSASAAYSKAPDSDELLAQVGFTPYEISILTEQSDTTTVKIRFHIVELIRNLLRNRKNG